MHSLVEKFKVVSIAWIVSSIGGGTLVTFGLINNHLSVILSLITFISIYYIGMNWKEKPIYIDASTKVTTEELTNRFLSEIAPMKARIFQLYAFDTPWLKNKSNIKVRLAFKNALLKTISEDNNFQSNRMIKFNEFFKDYIETQSLFMTYSPQSVDKLIFEIIEKQDKTKFQQEYIAYLTTKIVTNSKFVEELSFGYKIDNGQLSIKKYLNNWIGFQILSTLKLIDTNAALLGTNDLFSINLPPTQKPTKEAH